MQFTPTPEWQRKFCMVLAELVQSVEECYFTWPVSYKLRRVIHNNKSSWIWCRHAPDDWAIGTMTQAHINL
jgi:hypothetical protein